MTQELPAGWPAMSLARAHELLTAPGAPFVLPLNSDIQFFRAGIKPVWEDPANTNGGRYAGRPRRLS